MRIAVASSDGKMVNQHFGRAEQFLILDVQDEAIEVVEVRKIMPSCGSSEYSGHDDNTLTRAVALIADCEAVLCSRIGLGAQGELRRQGIQPVETGDFIEASIQSYVQQKERS
jgi:predicted Fe-Mo cluster-binding NifX family protein